MLHVPVLLEESLDFLLNDLSGTYLDLTFDEVVFLEILNRISSNGHCMLWIEIWKQSHMGKTI